MQKRINNTINNLHRNMGIHENRTGLTRQPQAIGLNRAFGNQAMVHLLNRRTIQTRRSMSDPNDFSEREADLVADQVMRMPPPHFQCKPLQTYHTIQPKTINENDLISDETESRINQLSGQGLPISDEVRSFMEPRFGADFSNVRIHTDTNAAKAAQQINAKAFTVGNDIAFNAGEYTPETENGKQLLAHELTHVLQQSTQIQRGENDEDSQDAEAGFGSFASPWLMIEPLVLQLPDRWQSSINKARETDAREIIDPEILHKQIVLLLNLAYAGLYTEVSSYDLDFDKSLSMVEALSGNKDTYVNLVLTSLSIGIQTDLEKYFESDQFENTAISNIGTLIIYGSLLQAGITGVQALMESDLNFTTLPSLALGKFTEAPGGFSRPGMMGNSPDPRWSYPFYSSPSGFDLKLTGYGDDTVPDALSMNFGLNIASIADLYPEDETEKAKYHGFEAYPYFSGNFAVESDSDPTAPEGTDRWLAGVFIGNQGVYTLIEGGYSPGSDGRLPETYFRSGLIFRTFGPLSMQLTNELSYRPNESGVRDRINGASTINLVDNETWKLTVGGVVGGLFPTSDEEGAVDFGGSVGLSIPGISTFNLNTMYRNQDPFNADSGNLFSIGGSASVMDWVTVSSEYHSFDGESTDPSLPSNDFRMMVLPGPKVSNWFLSLF